MNIDQNKLNWIYKKLFTIRFFEERIRDTSFPKGGRFAFSLFSDSILRK